MGPLAIVDLETTGLPDDPAAELLELGVVLLDAGSSGVATLSTLVRPSQPLPLMIPRLTGLPDAAVEGAPSPSEVAASFGEVLSGRVIVAHNADFERGFLSRFVSPALADSVYLDTQDLLALTHPDAPDLRLESFTRMLLQSEEQHRALEDALDTARVLSRVATDAGRGVPRYLTARRALERFAPESPWLALLGKDLLVDEEIDSPQFIRIGATPEKPVPFDEEAIAAALSDAERAGRYFPGYRVRGEQVELARHFFRNFDKGGSLFLEGGTGVGKSLAYLAAAIPFAMERAAGGIREPLVISTRTKLLQDQLLHKDIACAARMLGYPDLRALSIKGRANYICARRTDQVLAEGREASIFAEDRYAYAVLMACAQTRPHGEVGTLPGALLRRYPTLRDLLRRGVASRAEQCSREQCARQPACPFGRRRAALAKAHLIVANHDLLLRWPPDYPAFTHALVDEGHELAGVADEVYAAVVQPQEVLERVDEIFGRPADRGRGDALLPRKKQRQSEKDVRAWRRSLYGDLTAMGRVLAGAASEYGEVQLPPRAAEAYPEVAELAEMAADRLEVVAKAAEALDAERDEADMEEGPSPIERNAGELRAAASGLRKAFASGDDFVSAFEMLESPFDRWRLAIRAVAPADAFHERFMDRLESFAAVSASLFVSGDAFAAIGELEIEDHGHLPLARVSVESPFPYADHMRFVALKQPEGELVEETAEVIADMARRLGGRTLGLFTSLRRMNQTAELLAEKLRGEGFEILAPRRASDDPKSLVDRFCQAHGGAVLLGARTFWQGLDIPGSDLQAVVIEKLPFEVPTELRKRREARIRATGGDPFSRFALGKMLLHLKQMSGRLIRSEEDRGIVVVVEGRTDRRYFRQIARALPPGTQIRVARKEALAEILAEIGLGSPID